MKLILQQNLTQPQEVSETIEACESQGIEVQLIQIIPFSGHLPFDASVVDDRTFFYGSTTLIHNVQHQLNPRGVFFNPQAFTIESALKNLGDRLLGCDGEITTMAEFASRDLLGTEWFIRPNNDDKSFCGRVIPFDEFKEWNEKFQKFDNVTLNEETKILVSPPKIIQREWRNFIVDGYVVASSLYKEYGVLRKSRQQVPIEMISFVQECIGRFQPSDLFVIDVAMVADQFRVIECNCINSSGFYDVDKKLLFAAIRKYMDR